MTQKQYLRKALCCFLLLFVFFPPHSAMALEPSPITDSVGNTLILTRPVKRIACLYAFCGHVVTMLGRGEDIVAVVKGLKKDVLLQQVLPGIKHISVPAKAGIINIEALLRINPDLVFLKPETAAITAEIKKLDRFKLPYFVAGYHSMKDQMTIIEMMGKAIGREEKAFEYTRYYKRIIESVRQKTAHIPPEKKIRLYHSVNESRRTDGPGTIEADWTRAAGVINVSVGSALHGKGNKNFADIEQILIWNPDVIIVNEDGVDKEIRTDKKWAPIKAVQDNKIFAIPVGISRWGHPGGLETPLAILWTAKTVYPDLFKDIDLKKEIALFYNTFFGITLDNQMIERILDNKGMRRRSDH